MVILHNVSKRMVVLNLHGEHMRDDKALGYKPITLTTVDHLPNGTFLPRKQKRVVPDSLTLASGERRSGLPESILRCPDVAGAIARRELRVTKVEEDAPAETPAPAPEGERVKISKTTTK